MDGLEKVAEGIRVSFWCQCIGPRRRKQIGRKTLKNTRDESYILDLCDEVLGMTGLRQHRFDFLRGDAGKNGKTVMLPVDIFYPSLNLVIEYHERQHTEDVPLFDQRMTISGISRKEQRKRYDERRRLVLPQYKITVIEFSYLNFEHDMRKRLIRSKDLDEKVVRNELSQWLGKW